MDVSAFLLSLEQTGLASSIRDSLYTFPILESIHVMALAVVFGTITIVDLRLLGVAWTHRPFGRMSTELLRLPWGAFGLAALTGALMFMTNARVYFHNTPFRVKMVLLALAGLNVALFHLTAGRSVARWEKERTAPGIGRITATLSITLWVAIIFAGRVIGFTTTGAAAKEAATTAVPATNFDDFLSGGPGAAAPASTDPSSYSIRAIMAAMVDPSGDFLFESIADVADEHGVSHKAPRTALLWVAVRHHLLVLVDA